MKIEFYYYTGPHNRIHKNPSQFVVGTIPTQVPLVVEGELKSDFDLSGGEIYLDMKTIWNGWSLDRRRWFMQSCNYIHLIDESRIIDRWYYITDKNIGENGLLKLTLDCDLLFTFRDSLDITEIEVETSSISSENDINDGTLIRKETQFNVIDNFSKGLEGSSYILITAGPMSFT